MTEIVLPVSLPAPFFSKLLSSGGRSIGAFRRSQNIKRPFFLRDPRRHLPFGCPRTDMKASSSAEDANDFCADPFRRDIFTMSPAWSPRTPNDTIADPAGRIIAEMANQAAEIQDGPPELFAGGVDMCFCSPECALLVCLLPQLIHIRDEKRLTAIVQLIGESNPAACGGSAHVIMNTRWRFAIRGAPLEEQVPQCRLMGCCAGSQ